MNNQKWFEIKEDYDIARISLWCPKEAIEWKRDNDKGYYHLWKAYYAAIEQDEKEELLYARILIMMAREDRNSYFNHYYRFHKYIEPAKDAYDKAIANNELISDKEYEELVRTYNYLTYMLKLEDGSKESYSLIPGLNELEEFCFHDSKPIRFEHLGDKAELDLEYYEITIRIRFERIFDIRLECDPVCNWINEFYCYRDFYIPERIVFDIGFYKIVCEAITAEKL